MFRGYGDVGVLSLNNPVEAYMVCWEWGQYLGADALEKGVDVCVSSWTRLAPNTLPAIAKVAANYTAAMTAKWRARNEGFDDIVLLDEHGHVTEGPTANLFTVDRHGDVATPPASKVLLGITRDSIIALAPAVGCSCAERDIAVDELADASEVFLTGTSAGVWPVLSIDRRMVGDGRIGPVTARLRDKYRTVVRGEDEAFEDWLYYV